MYVNFFGVTQPLCSSKLSVLALIWGETEKYTNVMG